MGFLDSFKAFLDGVRDVVVGTDRREELRRRKRAAARRRYRANRRLRALGSAAATVSTESPRCGGVVSVVSNSPTSNDSSNLSVVLGSVDCLDIAPNQASIASSAVELDTVQEGEGEGEVESASCLLGNPSSMDELSTFDCVEGHENVDEEVCEEDSDLPVEDMETGSIASSVTVISGQSTVSHVIEDTMDPVDDVSNNATDNDLVFPVAANNEGEAIQPQANINDIGWRIPRRTSCQLSSGDFSIGTIPRESSSDDPFWTSCDIPDLMGLVVQADDLGKLFVVPRSFFDVQVYTACHLAYPHTVMDLTTELPGYLQQLRDPLKVVWYAPNQDHRDEFFVVYNLPVSVYKSIGKHYPFDELERYTASHETEEMDQADRQRAKLNRGWTGTQSMPNRDCNGHPIPSIKDGSHDPIIVRTLQAASKYINRLPVIWNENKPLQVPKERTSRFGAKLGDGVVFEGVTHTTHQRCSWHRDVQNPSPDDPAVSQVTCINKKMDSGRHLVSIYYFRLSICVNMRMNITGDPILRHFVETYLSFPTDRRSFSLSSVGRGDGFCAIAPNLDTISFHSLADICIVSLVDRFRLNLYETVSLIVCFLYMPNTTEPFARAAVRILQDGRMGRNIYGYKVGYMVARWMVQEQRSFNVRFNIYRGDPVLDEGLFESHTTSLFWLVLHVWGAYANRPVNAMVAKAYTAIRDLLKSLFRGVGNLIAMHTIQMLAEIGLFPAWLQTYACFDHTGRVFKWYAAKFSIPPTAVQARRLMASLPTGMQKFLACWVHESLIENLACKNFQRDSGGVECRRDVHHCKAPIVTWSKDGCGLNIVISRGNEIQLPNDCIIPNWRFGDNTMSMSEIADYLELPKALPGLRALRSSRLPNEAMASSATSNIQFNLPRWYS